MKVGYYVRTYHNGVSKILETDELNDLVKIGKEKWILPQDIIRKSNNIIDLIEVGDYVNGMLIDAITDEYDDDYKKLHPVLYSEDYNGVTIIKNSEDIKTILTKEQFKEMEYIINE